MASGYRKKGDNDVWDWNIYDSKGDRFSRGKSPKPMVYKTGRRMDGSSYICRVRTDEAKRLEIGTLVKDMRAVLEKEGIPEQLEAQMRRPWYWDARANALHFEAPKAAQRLEVSVTHPQLGGVRFWWLCPHCQERCTRLYAVMVWTLPNYGCRTCLGLTYPSQAQHKTPRHDKALDAGKTGKNSGVTWEARYRAMLREDRRRVRLMWEMDRLLGSCFTLGLEAQAKNEARKSLAFNRALERKGKYDSQKFAPRWKDVVRVHGFDEP